MKDWNIVINVFQGGFNQASSHSKCSVLSTVIVITTCLSWLSRSPSRCSKALSVMLAACGAGRGAAS
jgi:hypothetical protein